MTTISTDFEILAVVDNVIRLRLKGLEPDLVSTLRSALTKQNPAYHQMKSMRDRKPYQMRFTKLPAATISSFEQDEETFYIPRGFKSELIEICLRFDKRIKFIDETIKFPRDDRITLKDTVKLTDYQSRSQGALIMKGSGILIAPCGGGKTVTGIAIICALKQPTLIVVHTHDLMQQWQRELAEKTLLGPNVGQWGVGEKVRESVTVATIQTLIRMPQPELRALLDQFGCIVLDEAHHCPADTFMALINMSKSKFRFGLTATPKRKDGLGFLMFDTIGPIISEVTDADLQNAGRSQSCSVREIKTNFYTRFTADEWAKLLGELTQNKDRNNLILDEIQRTYLEGHFCLVLSDRVGHCKLLCDVLRSRGMNAHILVGEVQKGIRSTLIEHAKAGLIDVIVATKVADEGLDIPNLSCVHLVTPTANESKTQQRIGRIRRPVAGKDSLVVDYCDHRVPSCLRMFRERKALYKRWGFKNEGS